MSYVYKILRIGEAQAFDASGHFGGSPDDRRDGYIHLSFEDQLAATVARHFGNEQTIVIYQLEELSLGAALKLETSRGGALFPHYYGEIKRTDVVRSFHVPRDRIELWQQSGAR